MNAGTMTVLAVDATYLQRLSELPTELALQQAAPFLAHLVKDPAFFDGEIRPPLDVARGTEGDWYVAHSYWRQGPYLLLTGLCLASEHRDKDPRPFLMGSLLLCSVIRTRGALRASG